MTRVNQSDGMSWATLIDAYVLYLGAGGKSAGTQSMRIYHLTRAGRELSKPPTRVTMDDLVAWMATKDWAPNTKRAYRGSLRSFFTWMVATGRTHSNPAAGLPPVKIPRGRPRPIPEGDYAEAVSHADERTRLAMLLAGQCGLRRGEISRARREDVEVDLGGHSLRVLGKGGHTRLVPLTDDLAREILAHDDGWLFPSSHGGHLTAHHLGKTIAAALAAGHTTHSLRHRCATVSYAGTRDLRAVQELLGHAKPETTAIYTLVPDSAVRAAMLAAA